MEPPSLRFAARRRSWSLAAVSSRLSMLFLGGHGNIRTYKEPHFRILKRTGDRRQREQRIYI